MKLKQMMLSLFLILLLFAHCDLTDAPADGSLSLTLEEVSCTEAWLQFKSTNLQLPKTITLKQNGQERMMITLTTTDTLLYVDTLLPKQTYKFQLFSQSSIQSINQTNISSNEVTVTTLDTTSHNFTWQTWTFGEHSSSALYDVAIIDENNIWAVGEIYMNDSLGQPDPNAYNAVHWDGSQWKLFKLQFYSFCPQQTGSGSYPASSIFAFSENDIWISSGSQITHYNGTQQIKTECIPVSVNKLWGSSSNDLYAVGYNGNIAHFNGVWTKIESGTLLDMKDIFGQVTTTGDYEILCIASNLDVFKDSSKVLKIAKNGVSELSNRGLPIFVDALWFIPQSKYYIVGDGFYVNRSLGGGWIRDYSMPPYYKTDISGNGFNDIVMVGAYGLLMHFNGFSWKLFFEMPYINGAYAAVDLKGGVIICSGGLNNGKALVTLGKR